MGKKKNGCSKSCACYDCRGDTTWELLEATRAGRAARSSYDPAAEARATSKRYAELMAERDAERKGR
jgi:hypothetical protein